MSAAHYKLDNLIAIVDVNNHAGRRPFDAACSTSSRWRRSSKPSAGTSQRVNGNDIDAVGTAFDAARNLAGAEAAHHHLRYQDGARACRSSKQREKNHFLRVEPHEWSRRWKYSTPGGQHEPR